MFKVLGINNYEISMKWVRLGGIGTNETYKEINQIYVLMSNN